jgi:hypothetical protein
MIPMIAVRLSSRSIDAGWRGHVVVEAFGALPYNSAADETLERAQCPLIFRRNEADGIAHGMGATGATDAMDVILRVHRKVVVHDV